MPRIARIVVPDCWHHITQRGNRQQTVFLDDADRAVYFQFLSHHARRNQLRITGYCLMGNHIHLLAIPPTETALAKTLGRAHVDYARWSNLKRGQTGHLWQNRYYSCPLDESHQWAALRYVELNPVRAGLVSKAADWRWSSAQAHTGAFDRTNSLDLSDWRAAWGVEAWRDVLDHGIDDAVTMARIRDATRTGRPAATDEFLVRLEIACQRSLHPQKRGPKPKLKPDLAPLQLGVA